jgi:hypothetical protein
MMRAVDRPHAADPGQRVEAIPIGQHTPYKMIWVVK